MFKKLNEDANKKYLIAFKQYSTYMKGVRAFQEGIDKIATQKLEYDKIISHYTNIINDIDNPQNTNGDDNNKKNEDDKKIDPKEKKKIEKEEKAKIKKKNKEMKNKKIMLTKEKNKIMEKYAPIKKEFDAKTELLYKKKFKVTNEQLKQLRNEYFIDLAKKN